MKIENVTKNPLSLAFSLIQTYENEIKNNLSRTLDNSINIEKISKNLTIDHDLLFSINRKYVLSEQSLSKYQHNNSKNISKRIIDNIQKSSIKKSHFKDLLQFDFSLYKHQEKAINTIINDINVLLSTGTGSGKTESFLIPILSYCDINIKIKGIKAIIIYPMNALANDQLIRLSEYLSGTTITFGCYVRSTPQNKKDIPESSRLNNPNQLLSRQEIKQNPPDILITNHVMLDWILTDSETNQLFKDSAESLKYIVVDEIHTFRGNKATHLKYLLRRLKCNLSCPKKVIHIGTSATLKSSSSSIEGAYLSNESGDETLDTFIKELFDIGRDEYVLVEPEFEKEKYTSDEIYGNDHLNKTPFNFREQKLSYDDSSMLKMINILTDSSFSKADLKLNVNKIYERLNNNIFIRNLKDVLVKPTSKKGGAQFFLKDIIPILSDVNEVIREDVAKSFFYVILYLNQIYLNNPFMDFRVHLFLKNIGGYLKRCLKCDCYHSGKQIYCNDCGFPLFIVYKNDINKCIGKISNNKLHFELKKESENERNSFYVLLSTKKNDSEYLTFINEYDSVNDNVNIILSNEGDISIEIMMDPSAPGKPFLNDHKINTFCIPLADNRKDYQYIIQIISKILAEKKTDKKLLAFCDNKEKVSQFSMVNQDEFTSIFFEEYVKLILANNSLVKPTISNVYNLLISNILEIPFEIGKLIKIDEYQKLLLEAKHLTAIEKEVFREFPIWFFRMLTEHPEDKTGKDDFLVIDYDCNSVLETKILELFIKKRAIYKYGFNLQYDTKFIRFQKYLSQRYYGYYVLPDKKYSDEVICAYSLSSQSEGAEELVNNYSTEEISSAIQHLHGKGILLSVTKTDNNIVLCTSSEGKFIYTLNPDKILFVTNAPRFSSYSEIRSNCMLFSKYHSSELKNERIQTENQFKNNDINILYCTPTLELGIDIGRLNEVLMIGVPPLPSNYAQRAGRAGRGAGNNYALLVTFCDEYSNHDSYYFNSPKEIVNGIISPPSFDSKNNHIIKKHLAAFILSDYSNNISDLNYFVDNIGPSNSNILLQSRNLLEGCYPQIDLQKNIDEIFVELKYLINNYKGQSSPQHMFYKLSFFPDYEFSKDHNVFVVNSNKSDVIDLHQEDLQSDISSISLSDAEPDTAIYKFIPEQRVFMSGRLYEISSKGRYSSELICEEPEIYRREYQVFYADEVDKNASKSRYKSKYDQTINYSTTDKQGMVVGGLMTICYHEKTEIIFNNNGLISYDTPEPIPFNEEETSFIINYKIIRKILELKFDSIILADVSYIYSLVGALNRAIIDIYKLDEMELKIIPNAILKNNYEENEEDKTFNVIFYDKSGNGSIDFENIVNNIMTVLKVIYEKLKSGCCEKGCPICIRGYSTRLFGHLIKKEAALHLVGYLIGLNKFDPLKTMRPYAEKNIYGTTIKIVSGNEGPIAECNNNTYRLDENDMINLGFNARLFGLIEKVIKSEFRTGDVGLRILSNIKSLVDAINEGNINKDKHSYYKLAFQLLRYQSVYADKI